MMRAAILTLGMHLAAVAAAAQPLTVRSGEHDGFSRLVLPLPPDAGWSVRQEGRLGFVKIEVADVTFDTKTVFDRIPRTRLLNVVQEKPGAGLTLSLGCDCKLSGFVEARSHLVIDIIDTAPPTPRAISFSPFPSPGQLRFGISPEPLNPAVPVESAPRPDSDAFGPAIPPHAETVNASERRLMEQIGRAAGQGMVDLAGPATPDARRPGVSEKDEPLHSEARNAPAAPLPVSLVAVSAADRGLVTPERETPGATEIANCPDPGHFELSSWGTDEDFATQTAALLADLFSEFDRLDPEVAMVLSRTYLFFGFGAEARRTAELLSGHRSEREVLLVLAEIIDDGAAKSPGPLAGVQSCDSDAALWAAFAEPLGPSVRTKRILRSFARLPTHLRSHLGPILAGRFAEAGDAVSAEAVLRTSARAGDADADGTRLAEAEIAGLRNDAEAERDKLQAVASGDSAHAAKALIRLVEGYWRDGKDVPDDLPDLVGSHAIELRTTETGPEIRRAHVIALALASRFDEADRVLEDLLARDGADAAAAARVPVLTLMTERADDLSFLRAVIENRQAAGPTLPIRLKAAIARRLLDLGLSGPASAFMQPRDDGHASDEFRRLRAEISLGLGQPHRALVDLIGIDGDEAILLRARALAETGDHQAAGAALLAAGQPEAAARDLWLAGIQDVNPSGSGNGDGDEADIDPRYRDATEIFKRIAADDPNEGALPSLARARVLLEQSAATRNDVAALARMFDLPQRPDADEVGSGSTVPVEIGRPPQSNANP